MAEKISVILESQREQVRAVKASIIGSVTLFLVSAVVGVAVDSITLLLDAAASLVIVFVAFLMRASIKKVHMPPDNLYNFGYEKYEPLTVAVQGVLIIATCIISMKFALQDIIHPDDIHGYGIPVIATFFSGIIGLAIMGYLKKVGARTNSAMIKAASLHWYTDTMLSFGVCAGFLFGFMMQKLGYTGITPYVDPVMAILLALLFIQAPVKTVFRNAAELLDAAPGGDIYNKVKGVVQEYMPKSFGVYRLRARKAGEKIFVDVCFIVKDNLTVLEIEELAGSFERDLKVHIPKSDVVVYFKSVR